MQHSIPKVALHISTERKYGRDLISGIIQYAKVHGPWTFYRDPPNYILDDEKKRFSRLKKWRPDGIIARDSKNINIIKVLEIRVPTITASNKGILAPNVPNITSNDYKTGQMAAEHLLERGFYNFACVGFAENWSSERSRGFSDKIKQAGFKVDCWDNPKKIDFISWEKMQDVLAKWLKYLPKPIGIMVCVGELALNVLEACKIAKLCVPEQVAVITTDNDELIYNLSYPPISSVAYDTPRAGYEAAEIMERMMAGEKFVNKTICVEPTNVETRLSTNILAIEDQKVAKAIHFIRTNSKRNISVNKVLDQVVLSRSELNKRFRKYIGRTVHDEIARVRINEMISMLLKTNLPISQIATKLDFPYYKHISRFFHKQMGMSPQAYRDRHSNKIT